MAYVSSTISVKEEHEVHILNRYTSNMACILHRVKW